MQRKTLTADRPSQEGSAVAPRRTPGTDTRGRQETSASTRRIRSVAWSSLPFVVFLAILVAWGAVVELFKIPAYLLPGPVAVFERLFSDASSLWNHTQSTLVVIVIGLLLSIVIGIPLGLVIALSRTAKQLLYPQVMILQLVPKIAVAPLLLVWLGFSINTKIGLVILITFFPLLMASISGFRILDERLLYLTRSMGATRWQTFWFLRFPAALPVIFSGIKTSATIAITGALVAEFLGSNSGLGYALLRASGALDTTYMFAILVILTVIGVIVNYLVEAVEWLLTPWQRRT
ncbi:ABC transporter permease [Arthrobacter sp. 135MFCol5.1]|uniref:ABC transporter permease n=1 Tax=Arthrobacter sp. 135MFCol5.1 TaxID=1158050 RepID=UPI0009DA8579|nr:ABC transporter permease [Arthrobacter sp. 135MFCol5.1]